MNYQSIIAAELTEIFKSQFGIEKASQDLETWIEMPKNPKMGDHAVPCFPLARELKKAPPMIANEIAEAFLKSDSSQYFSKVAAAGPYLNFTVDKAKLSAEILPNIFSGAFLNKRPEQNKKVMVEYSQPNTHKAFHVGHTRNVALGDALVRLYEWSGYEVVASNYIGDVGTHIARCLWFFVENYLPSNTKLNYKTIDSIVADPKKFKSDIESFTSENNQNLAEFLGEMYSQATDLLDFKNLSAFPFPGILSARIEGIEQHPKNENWKVLIVNDGTNKHEVVCGGTAFKLNDIVAFAPIGSRAAGRLVMETDKQGTISKGMVLSEKEMNFSDEKNKIFLFDENTELGKPVSELGRKTDAKIEASDLVNDIILERNTAISRVLKDLEKPGTAYYTLWEETKDWSMDEFYKIYDWLGARFDNYFYESDVGDSGKKIVKEYLDKGVFVEDEGAIGVRLEDKKLPFFLVLKSDGTGLYSTKDLSLAQVKFEKFKIDKSIYVVDVGQSLHFQQVFASLEKMGFKQAEDCFHLAYGMVVLPDGKMSSRKGNVILFSQLKEALGKQINADFLDKYKGDWSEEEIAEAAQKISIGTIKYGMLNQDNNKNIVFDLNEWTAKSGNTGPYMMYAYARTRSIIRELSSQMGTLDYSKADYKLLEHETEQELVRKMSLFPSAVERATKNNEAQALCIYLFELSKDFSRMYSACSVIKAETDELKLARAALVDSCGLIIKKGLELIGIESLERM